MNYYFTKFQALPVAVTILTLTFCMSMGDYQAAIIYQEKMKEKAKFELFNILARRNKSPTYYLLYFDKVVEAKQSKATTCSSVWSHTIHHPPTTLKLNLVGSFFDSTQSQKSKYEVCQPLTIMAR